MRFAPKLPSLLLLAALFIPAAAQESPEAIPRLTNKEIVGMVKAGLSSDVIVAKIKVSRCNFDTAPSILAELKQGGAPDEVLRAMIEAPYGMPKAAPAPKPEPKPEPAPAPERMSEPERVTTAEGEGSGDVRPDRWHGLVLDESSPADALKVLGNPSEDKMGSKGVRSLTFKKAAGMKKALLVFQDGKLVSILLKPEQKINADALPNIYGVEFTPKFSGVGEAFSPQDYERHAGKVYAKTYPAVYELIAATERSRVHCLIANNSIGAILKQGAGIRDQGGFPGRVVMLTLLSRKLDDTRGAEILK
jgi:hypothetical protein